MGILSIFDPSLPLISGFFLIATVVALIVALVIHEISHAFAADLLGDPNPRLQGRLSPNPLRHLDPLGTIMLLFVGFGWAKPVQFDPYNLHNPRRDAAIIGAAGPISNLILALLASIPLHFLNLAGNPFLNAGIQIFITLNVSLAIFNLLPVPPLDGSHLIAAFLPRRTATAFDQATRRLGPFLLLFLILPLFNGQSVIGMFISPIIYFLSNLIIPN